MPHDIHQMMYLGKEPWHGLGTPLPANGSYEEIVHAAGFYTAALDHDDNRAVALHLVRMTKYARMLRLSRSSLLLHFRLLVGTSKERENIIAGCFDANFELMLKHRSDSDTEPSRSKEPPSH
jgi:hypothetical protein